MLFLIKYSSLVELLVNKKRWLFLHIWSNTSIADSLSNDWISSSKQVDVCDTEPFGRVLIIDGLIQVGVKVTWLSCCDVFFWHVRYRVYVNICGSRIRLCGCSLCMICDLCISCNLFVFGIIDWKWVLCNHGTVFGRDTSFLSTSPVSLPEVDGSPWLPSLKLNPHSCHTCFWVTDMSGTWGHRSLCQFQLHPQACVTIDML